MAKTKAEDPNTEGQVTEQTQQTESVPAAGAAENISELLAEVISKGTIYLEATSRDEMAEKVSALLKAKGDNRLMFGAVAQNSLGLFIQRVDYINFN